MNKDMLKIFYTFFGIVSWLATLSLFIVPMFSPFKGEIIKENNIPDSLFIIILILITIVYIAVMVLDLKNTQAAQYFQFVLALIVFTCSLPYITAFLIIAFVVKINIIQIFVPIILMIFVLFVHGLWFSLAFLQNNPKK